MRLELETKTVLGMGKRTTKGLADGEEIVNLGSLRSEATERSMDGQEAGKTSRRVRWRQAGGHCIDIRPLGWRKVKAVVAAEIMEASGIRGLGQQIQGLQIESPVKKDESGCGPADHHDSTLGKGENACKCENAECKAMGSLLIHLGIPVHSIAHAQCRSSRPDCKMFDDMPLPQEDIRVYRPLLVLELAAGDFQDYRRKCWREGSLTMGSPQLHSALILRDSACTGIDISAPSNSRFTPMLTIVKQSQQLSPSAIGSVTQSRTDSWSTN